MISLKGQQILLGVTGGIAAYKAAILARDLMRRGASVSTVLTAAATKFITPLSFESLTEMPCRIDDDMFGGLDGETHISLARNKDLLVIAPATATTIAGLALGTASNLLTATVLASRCPIVLCPAMHTQMWESVPVRRNIDILLQDPRYFIVPPDEGDLASGDHGPGRLPKTSRIVAHCLAALTPQTLAGRTVVVTAGPTREHIDPVRCITNPSSGRMGWHLAESARRRGADVRLILGPCDVEPDMGGPGGTFSVTRVQTTIEMLNAVGSAISGADALLMSAAPADERPVRRASEKIGKEGFGSSIEIEPNPDILATVAASKGSMVILAFAAETSVSEEIARNKMKRKGADLLFANPAGDGKGFGDVRTGGLLVVADRDGALTIADVSKESLAEILVDEVVDALNRKTGC
ncbi:MAG TPA: bifunctional phosphopantothenoylcysteine decarboxylase/phosphopantothenate--cysteine ligase CoaBC [Myxococcota bacterium]|nr:bifunctional phosphopantothenoylcysteine decarboxylase/phosphopantothenate--cysteine ligase CoaBC [Myxococcota bacterium]